MACMILPSRLECVPALHVHGRSWLLCRIHAERGPPAGHHLPFWQMRATPFAILLAPRRSA